MSIRQYTENGQTLFKVRVAVWDVDRTRKAYRQRTGIKTRKRAKEVEKTLAREAMQDLAERKVTGVRWHELVDSWELHLRKGFNCGRPIQKTTAEDHVSALRQYTSHWNRLTASRISKSHVRSVMDDIERQGKSADRMKAVKNAINSIYEWGIETGKILGIIHSPAFGVKINLKEEKKPEILNLNEIRTFLSVAQEADHPWYAVWAAALLTGMRSGELFALLWSDVEWETRRITVSKFYNGRLNIVKSTKAGYWREVPISNELLGLLRELEADSGDREHVSSALAPRRGC